MNVEHQRLPDNGVHRWNEDFCVERILKLGSAKVEKDYEALLQFAVSACGLSEEQAERERASLRETITRAWHEYLKRHGMGSVYSTTLKEG
jgi:hypothetical protein